MNATEFRSALIDMIDRLVLTDLRGIEWAVVQDSPHSLFGCRQRVAFTDGERPDRQCTPGPSASRVQTSAL
jgi:hypothetical protein